MHNVALVLSGGGKIYRNPGYHERLPDCRFCIQSWDSLKGKFTISSRVLSGAKTWTQRLHFSKLRTYRKADWKASWLSSPKGHWADQIWGHALPCPICHPLLPSRHSSWQTRRVEWWSTSPPSSCPPCGLQVGHPPWNPPRLYRHSMEIL